MRVELSQRADRELADILDYYAAQGPGLAAVFLQELFTAERYLREFPRLGRPLSSRTRGVRLKRFPYVLIYRPDPEAIRIIGIVHQSRHPAVWRGRVREAVLPYRVVAADHARLSARA